MDRQLVINNLLVAFTELSSQDSQKSVIFLHGWRSNKEAWNGVMGQLISQSANQPISLHALDLPGFGGSQMPSKDLTVGDYAQIVGEFIKKLSLNNVIIVGHSFGGRVGIKLSSLHPELISKLVLVDSAGFPMSSEKKSAMKIIAKVLKPFFKPAFMQGLRKIIYRIIGDEDYIATPALQKTFVSVVSEDLTSDMKNIKCPTLIINGENDSDTPVEFGRRMNILIQNSKFKILAAAGHFSFIDQPEEFNEELSNFIK